MKCMKNSELLVGVLRFMTIRYCLKSKGIFFSENVIDKINVLKDVWEVFRKFWRVIKRNGLIRYLGKYVSQLSQSSM